MKYPHVQQHDEKDCGAACLSMICEFYGLKLPIAKFRNLIRVDNQGANIYGLVTGAEKVNLHAEALEGTLKELFEGIQDREIAFPFIARIVNEAQYEHYIVVYSIKNGIVIVGDPAKIKITRMPVEAFIEQWQGQIIVFEPNQNFQPGNARKNSFYKFFKYITIQKKMLLFVFFMSIMVSAINIFGSVIFDYVLNAAFTSAASEEEIMDDEHMDEHSKASEGTITKLTESLEHKLSIVFENINTVCISIIILYIFRWILQMLRGYLLALVAKKVDVPLTLEYYNHLIDLPTDFFGSRKTGEFMSRFSDSEKIREAISTTTLTIMLDTILAIAGGALLYYISSTLFFITIAIMLVYSIIIFTFRRPIKIINHNLMEQDAQVTAYLKESIDGIETIKACLYENSAKGKTEKMYNKLADMSVKGAIIYNLQETIVNLIASIGVVTLLWSGTYLCLKDIISIGDLFTFYYLTDFFLNPVQNLINLQPELQTAVVAAERLNDILDTETEKNDANEDADNLFGDIRIKNVDFRYGNRQLVLKNINMLFPKGKKIAIVGESGCGKTTLAKLLMSFYKPETGCITINNKDLYQYTPSSIRRHIAYVSQDVFLFSDTVKNNLKLGNENATDEEIEKVCEMCMANEFIKSLPNGYDTMLEENGTNLSGGQKQRIAIARALLMKPDIIILDEATSNLDSITEQSFQKTIDHLDTNITCIIIAHRLKTIKSCDYIYVMEKGSVFESGTHEELIDKHGIYYQNVNA